MISKQDLSSMPLTVVRSKVFTDNSGSFVEVPALQTPSGVLEPLLDYCISRSHDRSLRWMRERVDAAKLFIQYRLANAAEPDNYRFFMNFAQKLYIGTCDLATGHDPSGLYWMPRPEKEVQGIITGLTEWFDHMSLRLPGAGTFNPKTRAGSFDQLIYEAAYQFHRDRAFLGHNWATNSGDSIYASNRSRAIRPARSPSVDTENPPAFPEERFLDLLFTGFLINGRYDYRNMLITLLLNGAGFRESEPFHLFMSDVAPDPLNRKSALVLIHHPVHGAAPGDWLDESGRPMRGNREAYLRDKWGLVPRNRMMGTRHAGWKGGLHESIRGAKVFRAYWFVPQYGEIFMKLWYRYMEEVVALRVERSHPYAFVNTERDPKGDMYKVGQYSAAFAAAVRRIGLQPSKELGTSSHGNRHAYGRRLKAGKLDSKLIQKFMHHTAVSSQDVYTQPTQAETYQAIEAAAARLGMASEGQLIEENRLRKVLSALGID